MSAISLSPHRIRIFTDFDGTVSRVDVGDAFFEAFAGGVFAETNAAFLRGEIDAEESFARYSRALDPQYERAMDAFLSDKELDGSVSDFLRWAEEKGYPVTVLSDGLDVYIHPLLDRLGVRVPVFCNRLERGPEGFRISSPFSDTECRRCGTCKRNVLATSSGDDDILVYIGDGTSDFCPVEYVDIVYARGALETWCQKRNISFRRFSHFSEIMLGLESLLEKRHFRRNRRAELARRSLWMRG